MDQPSHIFSLWSNFYVITGSSSAALTGLMFVVVTLVAGLPSTLANREEPTAAFSTPTVLHFCVAFFISAAISAPWRSVGFAALAIGLAGLFGAGYMARVTVRAARQVAYRPLPEDWVWYFLLPFATYVAVATSALMLGLAHLDALFVIAAATILMIFIGIHNAWDIVTWIAAGHGRDEEPPST